MSRDLILMEANATPGFRVFVDPRDSMRVRIIYQDRDHWELLYDGSAEYDESLTSDIPLPSGEWVLTRKNNLRRPDKYQFRASAPYWHFSLEDAYKAFLVDIRAAFGAICADLDGFRLEYLRRHGRRRRRHKRGKK